MKRLVVLVLLAALGLAACSDGDDPVATVNGTDAFTQQQLDDLLDGVADADDLLAAHSVRGAGSGTLSAEWVSSDVMYFVVQSELIRQALADEGVEVDADADAAGEVIMAANLSSPQIPDRQPVTVDQLPSDLAELYRTYYARYAALVGSLGGDLQEIADYDLEAAQPAPLSEETGVALEEAGTRLAELRADADVELDPAWGRWVDGGNGPSVAPPDGPASPPTTALAVPAG